MLTNISVWAVLTLSAILAPAATTETTAPAPAPAVERTTTITSMDEFRSLFTPKPVSVPSTVKLTFERVKVTSIAAPPPPPKVEEPAVPVAATPKAPTSTATAKAEATTGTKKATPAPVAQAPAVTVRVSPGSAQAEAANQMQAYGWGADQLTCLVSLWEKESNWNSTAENPSSGAYGIPQSLPGSKMASAGADWRSNPATQIKWGLGYIKDRYKTPCGAWGHSVQVGWY